MSNRTESSEGSGLGPDRSWRSTARRWLEALNLLLERAYLQADLDTGC
ncbi:MAG: hypothetical protein HY766_08665 [candidate division NC10 bacterium]|nr:hypothetical protein [candidate division NC10 bacterium]